jgi:sec-independent protein translocase protein TatC
MRTRDPDRMTFLEHLEELRVRLIRAIVGLCVGFGVCWAFREEIFALMTQPLRAAGFKEQFIYTSPAEALMLYMKMSFFVGIFVASPWLLYQIWAFISPGLYPNEKSWAIPFVGAGSLFFIAGAAFGHFYLFPKTFQFLGQFGGADMKFLPKIDEYYSFYSWFLLGLGLVFQIPVLILVLSRLGLVTPRFLLRWWKFAVLGSFIVAAFITPTPDMVTQTMLAGPMIGLYLIGVAVAALFGKKRPEESAPSGAKRT